MSLAAPVHTCSLFSRCPGLLACRPGCGRRKPQKVAAPPAALCWAGILIQGTFPPQSAAHKNVQVVTLCLFDLVLLGGRYTTMSVCWEFQIVVSSQLGIIYYGSLVILSSNARSSQSAVNPRGETISPYHVLRCWARMCGRTRGLDASSPHDGFIRICSTVHYGAPTLQNKAKKILTRWITERLGDTSKGHGHSPRLKLGHTEL